MANRFWVLGTGTWDASNTANWSTTTGGAGGASVPGASDVAIFDASSGGGVVTTNYDMTVQQITMGSFTGTLDFSANNNNPTMGVFSCTGTGVRTLNMGSGTWTITGNNTTIWNLTTSTNLTFNPGTAIVNCTYSGGTGTRTIRTPTTGTPLTEFNVTAGSDTINPRINAVDIDFTGFTGAMAGTTAITCAGSLTFPTFSSVTYSGTITFTSTSTGETINTGAGNILSSSVVINGTGGEWTLQEELNLTGNLTITRGRLITNNEAVFANFLISTGSNTRQLDLGSSVVTLGGNTGNIINFTGSNFTFNAGTSSIFINAAAILSGLHTIIGGGKTFNNVQFGNGTSVFLDVTGSNTFNTFNFLAVTSTLRFTAGTTNTFQSFFMVDGTTLRSITLAVHTISMATGLVSVSNCTILYSTATGGATWNAFTSNGNTDGGNNTGWNFLGSDNNGFFALF